MNAETFNALYEVGIPVFAYPDARPEDVRDATRLVTRTRSRATVLGGHTDVVWVDGHSACIALTHVDVVPEDEWARAAETAAASAPAPVATQFQPCDDTRLAEALAAYEGHPDLGFACCTAHAVADHAPALLAEVQHLKDRVAELEAGIAWRDAERHRWVDVHALVERAIDKGWSVIDTCDLEAELGPEPTTNLAKETS